MSGAVLVNLSESAVYDEEETLKDNGTRGLLRDENGAVIVKVTGAPFAGLTSAGKLPVGQAPGPVKLSAALPGLGDQGPLIQGELDALAAAGGGILLLPAGLIPLYTRTTRAHAGYGTVGCLLHIPRNCTLSGGGATETTRLYCDDRVLGAGDACFQDSDAGGGRLGHALMQNLTVTMVTSTPASFSSSATPPAAPWGFLLDRGHLEDIWFEGNLRASIASIGDHNCIRRCSLGGYAAVEMPLSFKTIGDLSFVECVLQGKFASILLPSIAGTNRAIQGWSFYRTHFGSGQAIIYAPSTVANQVLVLSSVMLSCSFEGMGRGLVYDPNRLGAITNLDITSARSNSAWFPNVYPTDGAVPLGAAIMCGAVTGLNITGGGRFFINPGSDPTSGAIFDVTSMKDCVLGDCSVAMTSCETLGVPFAKVTGTVQNVTGTRTAALFGTGTFRLAKATTAVAAGDVLRMVPTANLDSVRRFDSAGATPAGVAALSAPAGGVVPALFSGTATPHVARLGRATLVNSLNLAALPSVAGTSTLTSDVSLGGGALPPRTVETIAVGQTSLKASAGMTRLTAAATLPQATLTVADTTNLPVAGTVQTVAGTVTYTGRTSTTLTGCSGGSGAAAAGTTVAGYGDLPTSGLISVGNQVVSYTSLTVSSVTGLVTFAGIPSSGAGSFTAVNAGSGLAVGRVLAVASNASFSAAGAVKIGSTYMRYAGKSGTTYLYGVSPAVAGAASVTSGDTVTEVNTVPMNGTAENYKTVQGSAVMRSGPFGQILYGTVLPDRLAAPAASPTFLFVDVTSTQTGSQSSSSFVASGTRLNGPAAGSATTITVFDTTGFPSTGTLLVNGATVTYTGRTATTFTGCSGVAAAADGSPVTPKPQTIVTGGEKLVRPRYATGAVDVEDQGLATVAASHVDPLGQIIGLSYEADAGPVVPTRMTLPS